MNKLAIIAAENARLQKELNNQTAYLVKVEDKLKACQQRTEELITEIRWLKQMSQSLAETINRRSQL